MKTVDTSRIDILAGLSTAKSQRIVPDSPVEEAGFELFVPLGISASTSWSSRAWKSHGTPEEGFSVAGPIDAMGRAARHGNFVAAFFRTMKRL